MEIEDLEYLLGKDDFKRTLEEARDEKGCAIFETFRRDGPIDFFVVRRSRWDKHQRRQNALWRQHSSASSSEKQRQEDLEEQIGWSSDRKVMGAVEDYLENCVHTKVDIDVLERLMELENEEVSLRYILMYSTRGGSKIFQLLTQQRKRTISWQAENDGGRVRKGRRQSKKVGKMSGMHHIKCQGVMAKAPPCADTTLRTPLPQQSSPSSRDEESHVEDRRRRRVAFEETARGILRYVQDSEDLKVSVTELQEQLGMSEEASISIKQNAQQARNENGQHLFLKYSGTEKNNFALPAWPDGTRNWNVWLSWKEGVEIRCRK